MQNAAVGTVFTAFGATAALLLASCTDVTSDKITTRSSASGTTTASVTPTSTEPASFTPVVGSVVAEPVPVSATDGKTHLAYELELTNMLGQDATLTSVAAVTGDRTLLTLTGDQLAHWTRVVGAPDAPTGKLGPGQSALVWLDIAVQQSGPADIPATLTHTVSSPSPSPHRRCCPRR